MLAEEAEATDEETAMMLGVAVTEEDEEAAKGKQGDLERRRDRLRDELIMLLFDLPMVCCCL